MAYKDSFVDEYPYLVYSDDPEAVGGAGGGGGSDIGVPVDSTLSKVFNNTDNSVIEGYILSSADGEKLIAAFSFAVDGYISVAPNAFVGIDQELSVYVGPIGSAQVLEKVGSVTIDGVQQHIYNLSDPSNTYTIE